MNNHKKTKIRLLPDDWEVNKIEDIADVEYGKANPKTKGEVPVIGSGGVFASAKTPLVDYPTIIVGRKGTAGSVQLSMRPCCPTDTTFYLRFKREIEILFLY